jgi:hypothetical protein
VVEKEQYCWKKVKDRILETTRSRLIMICFTKFIDIKRSKGISDRRKKDLMQDKKYFTVFLKSKGYSELMDDVTTSVIREWLIEMQEKNVVYQTL